MPRVPRGMPLRGKDRSAPLSAHVPQNVHYSVVGKEEYLSVVPLRVAHGGKKGCAGVQEEFGRFAGVHVHVIWAACAPALDSLSACIAD